MGFVRANGKQLSSTWTSSEINTGNAWIGDLNTAYGLSNIGYNNKFNNRNEVRPVIEF